MVKANNSGYTLVLWVERLKAVFSCIIINSNLSTHCLIIKWRHIKIMHNTVVLITCSFPRGVRTAEGKDSTIKLCIKVALVCT